MEENNQTKHKNKRKSKKSIIVSIALILLALILSGGLFVNKIFGNIEKVDVNPEELGLTVEEKPEEEKNYGTFRSKDRYINIALLGVDTRAKGQVEDARADSIMILSIDRENKSMKLASVARDTYANIEGHGMDKINQANAEGGPTFMVKTLNQNFNLNITDFVIVDFWGVADIIDTLNGVVIEVDAEELLYINGYIDEVARISGKSVEHIFEPGLQILNGPQAVAYSRIRYTVGGDFKRTERQREVLLKLAEKSKEIKVTDIVPIITQLSSSLTTTLDISDMTNLAMDVIKGGYMSNMSQKMFPEPEYSYEDMTGEVYYYVTDLKEATRSIHKFLYGK